MYQDTTAVPTCPARAGQPTAGDQPGCRESASPLPRSPQGSRPPFSSRCHDLPQHTSPRHHRQGKQQTQPPGLEASRTSSARIDPLLRNGCIADYRLNPEVGLGAPVWGWTEALGSSLRSGLRSRSKADRSKRVSTSTEGEAKLTRSSRRRSS